eukprot:4967534-Pyramimonas_sp.AAC.1
MIPIHGQASMGVPLDFRPCFLMQRFFLQRPHRNGIANGALSGDAARRTAAEQGEWRTRALRARRPSRQPPA